MKFSQSERSLHPDPEYTPACNYYHQASETAKILTGSLAGPSLTKQLPNFGQATRFSNRKQKIPGPGSYFNEKKNESLKQSIKNGAVIRQYKKHGFLGGEERSPSIPYSQFNPDQEDENYIKQILINQDVIGSVLATKRKHEGHTFSKSPRNFNLAKIPMNQQPELEVIAQYTQKMKELGLKAKMQQNKQQIKRSNQRRAEIINMMNPEFVPSLELIEIITKRRTKYTPGPGYYAQDDSKPTESGISFPFSKRFSEDKASSLGPGKYPIQEEKKKSISFSKSSRNLFNMKGDTDLEHRFYIDPLKAIKMRQAIQQRGKEDMFSFGSQVARFKQLEKQPATNVSDSIKARKKSKIEAVVEMRLQKMHRLQTKQTAESEGLLGISTMLSTIQ